MKESVWKVDLKIEKEEEDNKREIAIVEELHEVKVEFKSRINEDKLKIYFHFLEEEKKVSLKYWIIFIFL